ncbi:helix-turn-helix domain-containing protein [Paraburkholderia silvatlantica]|uniref:Transcriptional regulator n=1 Tax=Paraburkholderia silvatlantica TaxID=321895 RepID=A0ABR6FMU1_9BURK|nr:helix-turn-helix transcriptional regulator [Paraburkholderia silvatlantica]MBB2928363.1 putative transcriptional regulator [Paraburkholderia silvatlantica]
MNWKLLLAQLAEQGVTQVQIAAEIGVRQSTVSGLASGAQSSLRWEVGERLIALHARLCSAAAAGGANYAADVSGSAESSVHEIDEDGAPAPQSESSTDDVQPPAGAEAHRDT